MYLRSVRSHSVKQRNVSLCRASKPLSFEQGNAASYNGSSGFRLIPANAAIESSGKTLPYVSPESPGTSFGGSKAGNPKAKSTGATFRMKRVCVKTQLGLSSISEDSTEYLVVALSHSRSTQFIISNVGLCRSKSHTLMTTQDFAHQKPAQK